jgi:homoaconitate hydratase
LAQTVVEKIAQAHLVDGPDRPVRAGDFVSIRPRHVLTHDNTSAAMSKFTALGAGRVVDPRQPVFALDHDIQNRAESNLAKYRAIERFAREQEVDFYPAGTGIGHQVMVEQGYVAPGAFVVASDSHANMYGALGAIGTPVVRTDAAVIWATGAFWWQIPRTVRVVLEGDLPPGSTGKDVIIALCGLYNEGEVLNAAVEFSGPGVAGLSMGERLSIANMSTEWGALVGWFPVDDVTLAHLRERGEALRARGVDRIRGDDLETWAARPPLPDADAAYAARIVLDLRQVTPHISGPDTVQVMAALADVEARRVPIQKAYLISCVNARLEDLETAARVVAGRRVAPGVTFYVAPASHAVQEAAERSGAWQALLDAGALALPAGCGPCIGLGAGVLEPGEVGISATNRNFKGRMGAREAQCYLANPAVVAASAVAGYIRAPEQPAAGTGDPCAASTADLPAAGAPARQHREFTQPAGAAETVEILEGFPRAVRGRLVYLPQDNLNTDGIYGKEYTYRDDVTPETMARVVMHNYDPRFVELARAGDVVVGGFNFGTGSSREQAATALAAKGIRLVIAGSFSQIFLRNAFNNGFLCLEVPALVARLRQLFAGSGGDERTIIPGDELAIDFSGGVLTYRDERFQFAPLGAVPQALIAAGGVENQVARTLRGSGAP